jgi:hypothetical protein
MIFLARTSSILPYCVLENTNNSLLDLDHSVAACKEQRVQDLIAESLPSNGPLRRACLTALFRLSGVLSCAYVKYTHVCMVL